MHIALPYGRSPLTVDLPRGATIARLPAPPAARPLTALLADALAHPIASAPLEELARAGDQVLVIVSDTTRDEPRRELIDAVLARLPRTSRVRIAIANGTHGPCDPARLDLPAAAGALPLVNHDARDTQQLVTLGVTPRGTPLRVHRALAEADVVVATGCIRPHYFAGFGGGAKALFPGLGGNDEVRINHRLKGEPGSRPGRVDGNPCRDDLEAVVAAVPGRVFLLNVVADHTGGAQDAVAGDALLAFRRGAALARALHTARVPAADCILVSDRLPLTASLYQASKLVAAVASHLRPGGTVVLAAECPEGTGPLATVNHGIYDAGLAPRLPAGHRIVLKSGLPRDAVAATYCDWCERVEDVLDSWPLVIPDAGSILLS
jgi:nickel-dependent lactate racemase